MTVVKLGPPPQLLTVDQVADRLNVSRSSVYRLIQRRELTAVHVLQSTRISSRALASYIRGVERAAATSTGVPGATEPRRRTGRRRSGGPSA